MNIKRIFILPIFLFLIFTIISGCSDSTTSPTQNNTTGNVNGKVIDLNGAPISGASVLIGSSLTTSGSDGSFTISSVTSPYDAKVLVNTGSSPSGVLYQGLTTFSPQLYCAGTLGLSSASMLNVTIPAIGVDQRALIIFTDNGTVHFSQEISNPATTANLNVKWTSAGSINGKVIVLVYTFTAGQISTYNKYGEINTTLTNGGTTNITFSSGQLNVTPQQSTISGTLNIPAGYMVPKTHLILKFGSSGNIASGAFIGNEIMGTNFNYVVPAVLTSSFSIGVQGSASGSTGEYTFKTDTVQTGEVGKVISLETPPSLTAPVNGQTGVDVSTNFTYSAGTGSGVYFVTFNGTGRTFIVITSAASVTIPNFSSIGLGIGTNITYNWSVGKVNFGSVNDVAAGSINLTAGHNSDAITGSRTFVTGP